jgi:callose synthase
VVLCLYAFLYGKFYLVMSGIQFSLEQQAKITSNASLLSAINTVSLVQIGLLMGLPMVMEMGLEQGFRQVTLASSLVLND